MRRILKIRLRVGSLLIKPFLASIIMGFVVYAVYNAFSIILLFIKNAYLINGISAIISIFIGALTYFATMFLIKGISLEDINIMPNKLSRYIPKILLDKVK